MPVDQKALLSDCQKQLKLLEADLKAQAEALADLDSSLRAEWAAAREAGRVGDAFEIWRGEQATQAAVHWVLGCVFVRFLEDNALIDPLLAGAGDRGRLAEAAEQAFYGDHPTLHERDWLLHAFSTVARLPGGAALFDERHNPVFRWPLTPDAAKRLVQFWRRPDPNTGEPVHGFLEPNLDTRFFGDLYQDLSESAQKKYALLQTPVFVEEFILDRTLGDAVKELPLARVTVIDPTCGSGHFLLGAFVRLLEAWEAQEPGALREELAQWALDQVAGVDLNPFAVAIARFRLLTAALKACGVARLERAPAFRMHVAVGDSLLHGDEPGRLELGDGGRGRYVQHAFSDEDLADVNAILRRRYTVVVGNPPYITVKDRALRNAYRERYSTCQGKYTLSVPFIQRFWELAEEHTTVGAVGWIGMINANAFMKREYGAAIVESFFPQVDLTHVISTDTAYIPGHGTPTVILLGRKRSPVSQAVRVVSGLRGEPGRPADPAQGQVWTSILSLVDRPGEQDAYVSVSDLDRAALARHPWSIGGGGAAELKQRMEEVVGVRTVAQLGASVGIVSFTLEDWAYMLDKRTAVRAKLEAEIIKPMLNGDDLRDWVAHVSTHAIFPYDDELRLVELHAYPHLARHLWRFRTLLGSSVMFGGKTKVDLGMPWYEYGRLTAHKLRAPLGLGYAEVATHNHFVLSRGGVVYKNTVQLVKLPDDTDQDTYLALQGVLNSSAACFWLKQVAHNKGSTVDQAGARQRTSPFEDFYQFNGTKVAAFPVPAARSVDLAAEIDELARERQGHLPSATIAQGVPTYSGLEASCARSELCLARMIALQEELDWRCYDAYEITAECLTYRDAAGASKEPPQLHLGERAFEIVLARRMAAGDEESTWFERHCSTPLTELPANWPADYKELVDRRIALIQSDRDIGLIELPEYKRRWNVEPWGALKKDALADWLLDRLESPAYWPQVTFQTTRDLAARAATDVEFGQVAALWAGSEGVALEPVIRELALGESVPFLSALRYTESGREKRRVWENTWEVQRHEDAIDAAVAAELPKRDGERDFAFAKRLAAAQKPRKEAEIGAIPRPPKYVSADFQRTEFWRMRGALDVPKERFIFYPHLNRDGDDAPLLGWAGWNHLQQAQALAAWYADRTQLDGWQGARLVPMLAGMAELVPWLLQWHNEIDPAYGARPGEAYTSWLDENLHAQGITRTALDAWEPPRTPRRGARRRT